MDRAARDLPERVRWLIAGACAVTFVAALSGLDSLVYAGYQDPRASIWFRDGTAYGIIVALTAAFVPVWRLPRLMRVALVLPFVHLAIIIVAARAWSALHAHALNALGDAGLDHFTLPSIESIAVAVAVLALASIAIKRRRGEWAHALVMLSLTGLLLVGVWLPIVCRAFACSDNFDAWLRVFALRAAPRPLLVMTAIPPLLASLAFTAFAFRAPHLLARYRSAIITAVKIALGVAVLVQLTTPNPAAMLYIEHSYTVLFAVVVAVVALVNLMVVTWLRSYLAHRRLRRLQHCEGVIAADERGFAATFEITSWLRGPRLATRAFVVTTPHGDIPVTGATVLANVPATTTGQPIGGRVAALRPGDRVVVAARTAAADGHPFRAMDVADVALLARTDATPYRFADVALVVWRPAVAYLAILVAAALPALVFVLA